MRVALPTNPTYGPTYKKYGNSLNPKYSKFKFIQFVCERREAYPVRSQKKKDYYQKQLWQMFPYLTYEQLRCVTTILQGRIRRYKSFEQYYIDHLLDLYGAHDGALLKELTIVMMQSKTERVQDIAVLACISSALSIVIHFLF